MDFTRGSPSLNKQIDCALRSVSIVTGAFPQRQKTTKAAIVPLSTTAAFSQINLRPIRTPMIDAIIKPRVHPLESPKQCSPFTLVLKS